MFSEREETGMIKEAIQYIADLRADAEKTEVVEICGKTYANRALKRYGEIEKAVKLEVHTLSALLEYIKSRGASEFSGDMILHVENPKTVTLISGLNKERSRETLMASMAEVSEFRFGTWYDQERFIIELQSNFERTPDLDAVMQFSGNVEAKTTANYGDDGITQKATISKGIASKVDAIVPNPVVLVPYRTFQEVAQPASNFVFRVRDNGEPEFCLIEAGNHLWRNEAIENVKEYLKEGLKAMPEELTKKITIIG